MPRTRAAQNAGTAQPAAAAAQPNAAAAPSQAAADPAPPNAAAPPSQAAADPAPPNAAAPPSPVAAALTVAAPGPSLAAGNPPLGLLGQNLSQEMTNIFSRPVNRELQPKVDTFMKNLNLVPDLSLPARGPHLHNMRAIAIWLDRVINAADHANIHRDDPLLPTLVLSKIPERARHTAAHLPTLRAMVSHLQGTYGVLPGGPEALEQLKEWKLDPTLPLATSAAAFVELYQEAMGVEVKVDAVARTKGHYWELNQTFSTAAFAVADIHTSVYEKLLQDYPQFHATAPSYSIITAVPFKVLVDTMTPKFSAKYWTSQQLSSAAAVNVMATHETRGRPSDRLNGPRRSKSLGPRSGGARDVRGTKRDGKGLKRPYDDMATDTHLGRPQRQYRQLTQPQRQDRRLTQGAGPSTPTRSTALSERISAELATRGLHKIPFHSDPNTRDFVTGHAHQVDIAPSQGELKILEQFNGCFKCKHFRADHKPPHDNAACPRRDPLKPRRNSSRRPGF